MARRPIVHPTILAAKGVPIILTDQEHNIDKPVSVCFTFSAIMNLEQEFGSLQGAMEVLNQGEGGAAFTSIVKILGCGLEHETTDHGALSDLDVLAGYVDTGRIKEYADALGEAFKKAFPPNLTDSGDAAGSADPSSLGASGTTSPPSGSDSLTPSSGA
jgi:hypothetical protein